MARGQHTRANAMAPLLHLQAQLLFDQIAERRPDVVALQEVTYTFLQLLHRSGLVHPPDSAPRSGEAESRGEGDSASRGHVYHLVAEPGLGPINPYGTALLTRHPPHNIAHAPFACSDMDRSLLGCVLHLPPPSPVGDAVRVAVGTAHLESPEGGGNKDNFKLRGTQCADALRGLATLASDNGATAAILLGDFNATRGAEEEAFIALPWRDVWREYGHTDPGYTYDAVTNDNAHTYQSRLDKIVYANQPNLTLSGAPNAHDTSGVDEGISGHSGHSGPPLEQHEESETASEAKLVLESVQLVGTLPPLPPHADPLSTPPRPVRRLYASDHYGVLATFGLCLRS